MAQGFGSGLWLRALAQGYGSGLWLRRAPYSVILRG